MKRELSDLEMKILESGSEDYYGLWEIRFLFLSRFPGEVEAKLLREAAETVRRLIDEGLISLHLEMPEENRRTLASEEIGAALSDEQNWLPHTPREPSISFDATEEGERLWREWVMGTHHGTPGDAQQP